MPFATFALPLFSPRRWEIVVLACVLALALGIDAMGAGWGTMWRALGLIPGVAVGATMATRTGGRLATWGGLLGGVVAAGLVPPMGWTLTASTTAALFAALGMGTAAWWRVRVELTYSRRVDLLCGLATVALVVLAVGLSGVSGLLRWTNVASFGWGAALLLVVPRLWELPVRSRTGSQGPESPLGRTGP